ncbi:uncharacterized protein MONBRDRAFT_21620 [Monosiga brevicollis MX1]|uniref:Molecular chaperone DnaK n=1 Tax=Monosiga brevicollis TaxID=81824 RepID=A9V5B6_MONBE|nr:uncharacterized protein MONBRDRAFT_21620 [Monosiga brevicollis MX1]EDQ87251.1 predicted protein [Monosiga brevicollis MX1]|eukprot:XP_001747864.1 hypothetical protein [Monosiga brevicollis MX1]
MNELARRSESTVGIDLGTTQSCVAYYDGQQARVLADEEGRTVIPSVVSHRPGQDDLVGHAAERQAELNPKATFATTKRLIGRLYTDEVVADAQRDVTYDVVESDNGEAWVYSPVTDRTVSPSEIAGSILGHMRRIAEQALAKEVRDVVVTVPAYFNDNQRQATRNAGLLAGLNVMRCVNEPTAAALAHGIGLKAADRERGSKLAVYDLGGGTFDISILQLHSDGTFEVLATNGDTFLGGEDVDSAVAEQLVERFKRQHGTEPDDALRQRLRLAAEKAKIELDQATETTVVLPFAGEAGRFETRLSRAEFEEMIAPVLARTEAPCRQCLKDAGLTATDLDKVLLVGGMTRTLAVHDVPSLIQEVKESGMKVR